MNFAETCIRRPVLTIVMSLLLILIGIMAMTQLQLKAEPTVFRPTLNISVSAPGSNAQYIEENIVTPLENRLQATEGLSNMRSTSSGDEGQIRLQFANTSQQDFVGIQSHVLQAVNATPLPDNASTPRITIGHDAGTQLFFLAISAKKMPHQQLLDYAKNHIEDQLQQIPGVGEVTTYANDLVLRVALKPKKMAELGVTPSAVIQALQVNNVSQAAGQILTKDQAIPIILNRPLSSYADFEQLTVLQIGQRRIKLSDVADIAITENQYNGSFTFYRDTPAVGISIVSSDRANPITVGKQVRQHLKAMSNALPPGMQFHLVWDQASIIQHSVEELFWTIGESIGFVAIITLLFLGRWRMAMIPVVTIPICMMASFAAVWLLGFSMNLMTLLALVLAVGLVVDDAIVVLENAYRHIQLGQPAMQAALTSMREITFPVIGMTLAIVAVYLPTAFLSGRSAAYFQQFSFTLAAAVLISGFVALTLTPMMCAYWLNTSKNTTMEKYIASCFSRLASGFEKVLNWIIGHAWLPISAFFLILASGYFVMSSLPSTLLPKEYAGYIMTLANSPDTASTDYTKRVAQSVIKTLMANPSIADIVTFGSTSIIKLTPAFQRPQQTIAAAHQISQDFASFTPANVFSIPLNTNGHTGGGNQPGQYAFYLSGYLSYDALSKVITQFTQALKDSGQFLQVSNGLRYSDQQYTLSINQTLANTLGVPIQSIISAMGIYFGGTQLKNGYQFNGINYPIVVQLPKKQLTDFSVLNQIMLTSGQQNAIPLSRLVQIHQTTALPERVHINGMRTAAMSVVGKPDLPSGDLLKTIKETARSTLPSGIQISYSRDLRDISEGNTTATWIFVCGIVSVYLIFAALFESFLDPLIILFTVPLCIVAALIALRLVGGSLNIYSDIGLVTLIGLISKHGVLITQFANTLGQSGKNLRSAIVSAASTRLRPILMTTITMMAGAIPLLLSQGAGENGRHQIGWVIIAGLAMGTLFSLVVVPVAYYLLKKRSSV